jgi:Xaa-Pro aminopeptidase
MAADRVDALVVTSLPNILYLTNFTGTTATVVMTMDRLYFVTDFRYLTSMVDAAATPAACPGLELAVVESTYDAAIIDILCGLQGRIGVESQHLTLGRYNSLMTLLAAKLASPPEVVPTDGLVERRRVCKDDFEVSRLREGARRLSAVANDVFGDVRPGITEAELALSIDSRIRRAGFSRTAFETIVASGPNAALPHARPGGRTLTDGDLVVLDFGGVYDSYCVDLTRTVSIGPAGARAREVHAAVREAQELAIAASGPSASRFAIDAAARDALAARGLGDAFGHGTGHGLGIEVHEDPRITRRRPDVDAADEEVKPGMVFTIEPGAYLPGWGGVRIEDDVLITEQGVELLTNVTRDLLET